MKELEIIQQKLNAPKDLLNKYGGYHYRSCESILAALKPLLASTGCTIVLTDDVEMIGDRYYIRATATLKNSAGETETASGYAREGEQRKGMDDAQLTGATSSYARKYALNGLFAIDDVRDIDATAKSEPTQADSDPRATVFRLVLPNIKQATTIEQLTAISDGWLAKYGTYKPLSDALNERYSQINQKK